jgi:2-haloacid dehalogenase
VSLGPLDVACERVAPGRGAELAAGWRQRQLEATWLLTSMERWADLDSVTRDALRVTLEELGIVVPAESGALEILADTFADLPLVVAADDVVRRLHDAGLVTGILTNASARTLERVAARLGLPMDHLLSVDSVRRFKPHPSVYRLASDATGLAAGRIGFVTANGWDAAGAAAFGLRVAWLRPGAAATLPAVGAPEPAIATWRTLPGVFLPGGSQ